MCTFISQVDEGTKEKLPLDSNLVPWIVRWAGICHSRYAVGKDGRTAYERMRGRTCKAIVIPVGERVWYKRLRPGLERKNKAETEMFEGIWLGPAVGSPETLVGTKDGVVRGRHD